MPHAAIHAWVHASHVLPAQLPTAVQRAIQMIRAVQRIALCSLTRCVQLPASHSHTWLWLQDHFGLSQPLPTSDASPAADVGSKPAQTAKKDATNPYGSISSADVHVQSAHSPAAPPADAQIDKFSFAFNSFDKAPPQEPPADQMEATTASQLPDVAAPVGNNTSADSGSQKRPSLATMQPESVQTQDSNFHISYKTNRSILRLQGCVLTTVQQARCWLWASVQVEFCMLHLQVMAGLPMSLSSALCCIAGPCETGHTVSTMSLTAMSLYWTVRLSYKSMTARTARSL